MLKHEAVNLHYSILFIFRMGALHQAALVGNTTIMQLLLESSAAADLEDNKGDFVFLVQPWLNF